ncbi:hypothetical protein CTAYLR_006448 [Chrysophaeum taylorii]|uniref:Uncharacterized protein n=1 Tax=Chrysophaeum taylorii TaxID=2483200 RepID=A0AAD7XP24_9STRA|nr:hypothetical protein CTAYLR_006448 [Chrysophaeum taylorii]
MGLALSACCCVGSGACCVCRSCFACCPSCCPGDDDSRKTNPNAGRCGSLWIMILAMILSLVMQYYVAQRFDWYAFNEGCSGSHACRGAAMVYRISFCTACFFAALAAASHVDPRIHDSAWGAKFGAWVTAILISCVIPNSVFFGYVWVARIGAFVFVVLQQVLLIDLAYFINDTLVTEADSGTYVEVCGLATPLIALLAMSFVCFVIAIIGITLLFVYFGTSCESPNVIMSLTIIFIVIATLCQLFSQDSNLLTSSVVAVYATYLAAAALSANPVSRCNPFYSTSSDWVSIVLGIGFTVIALIYTIYSASYQVKYLKEGRGDKTERAADNAPGGALMNKILTGQLPESTYGSNDATQTVTPEDPAPPRNDDQEITKTSSEVASFNIVMCLMAMNVAMTLTNWGSTNRSGRDANNPRSGKLAMWMQASSQWVALSLYIWTCIAPILFPDRDFS